MATRKVKTPRQRQQERKEQMQREQTMEKIISAMTETVTRLQTVSAWAQWQNNTEAMTKGSHEATRSSSEQEIKNMLIGINTMMLQQQQQTDAETNGNADDDAADHATADTAVHGRADEDATRHDENSSQRQVNF